MRPPPWLPATGAGLNGGSRDLWLSATGAGLNSGWRPPGANAAVGLLFRTVWRAVAENAFALNILRIANNFKEMFHAPLRMEDIA